MNHNPDCPHTSTYLWSAGDPGQLPPSILPTIDCYTCGRTQLAPTTWHHNRPVLEIPTQTPPPPPTPTTKHTNPTAIFQGTGNIAS